MADVARRYGLTPVINLSGPLTMYGTSASSVAVAQAAAGALQHQWNMDELFQRVGELIARWAGTDAGFLTASSAAGITLAVAACMTGSDLGKIEQLPDATCMKHEVLLQKGHAVNFGAPIEQMIRLAGATVRECGTVNRTTAAEVGHAMGPETAAAVFVVSHHTAPYGCVPLAEFVHLCHDRRIPVIIDAAAQDHQIDRLVASDADLIITSVQKYLAGPTASAICGRKDLIRAIYLQNHGIGRPMKVGKEGIFGTIVAFEERVATDLGQWAAEQRAKAIYLADALLDLPGITVSLEQDKVGQPVTRVRLEVDTQRTNLSAEQICAQLEASEPSIKPRAHHAEEGWFLLEPNHVTHDELDFTARRLHEIVVHPETPAAGVGRHADAFLAWLDG